jgi:cytochrome c2
MLLLACTPTPSVAPAQRAPVTLSTADLTGQSTQGKAIFAEECEKCHQITQGKNSKGPQLSRIYGSPAAALTDYQDRYSKALKASQLQWNAATLDAYLADPEQSVAQGKMLYDGLTNPQQRQDVIAYLATLK